AAALMGVERVRLYHDQALFKEAGGGFTPWHQDQHYWPLATDNTITMWMPLVDVTQDMGTLQFASGSHVEGYLGDMPISDESQAKLEAFVKEKGFGLSPIEAMQAGDATFHSGWALHAAGGNSTESMRSVMTIIYYADGTKVAPLDNKNRINDRDTWLPGLDEGQLAATELNPVI
ncbi:MAG: phytanoyl-CoA dioxygenase family protein, partial [Chloroflexota bacterium]